MKLKGQRIAVLVEDAYEDLELWYPALRFREEGAEVQLVGPSRKTFYSKHGYPAEADLAVQEAQVDDFQAVIIPGGYAPDKLRRHEGMVAWVREMNGKGKLVAAICHAGWMLASADILRGRRVTGFFSIRVDLVNAGAEFVDQEVVQDGNLITSRTPRDLPAFCRTILQALEAASA